MTVQIADKNPQFVTFKAIKPGQIFSMSGFSDNVWFRTREGATKLLSGSHRDGALVHFTEDELERYETFLSCYLRHEKLTIENTPEG